MRDIEYFKKVEMGKSNYSICWPNRADFSPDALYEVGKDVESITKKTSQKRKNPTHSISKIRQTRIVAKAKH